MALPTGSDQGIDRIWQGVFQQAHSRLQKVADEEDDDVLVADIQQVPNQEGAMEGWSHARSGKNWQIRKGHARTIPGARELQYEYEP